MAICGIDLGTTNSLIAVFTGDGPELIRNAHGEFLTPSVVGLDESGRILVGRAARERLVTHPDETLASFKRFMGTAESHQLGNRSFRPEELSAFVLRSLKDDAETYLGQALTDVVISVPAYFNDHQRKATIDAGRLAGLPVERLINEPTAAALAYGLGERKEGKFLVFDLGGGTFDVSILDKYEGVMEVRATAGDTMLGGNDFTKSVENILIRRHNIEYSDIDIADKARVLRTAEDLKIALTSSKASNYSIQLAKQVIDGVINSSELEAEVAQLMRRLRVPIERALTDASLGLEELDCVILVGGATRMPFVRSMVARLFGQLPLVHVDADTTVALGASVQAGLKSRSTALDDIVMTDVCPFTLGVAVVEMRPGSKSQGDLRVAPIIERNAVVPISRNDIFSTISNQQSAIKLEIYQGENLRPENNVRLGEMEVKVPPKPAGEEAVDVRFTYDINGALEVEAIVLSTGKKQSHIFRNDSGLSEEELANRFSQLEKIKLHPRDQSQNKALIARAERIYAEGRGEIREIVVGLLSDFRQQIADQSLRDIEKVRKAFAANLDQIERVQIFDE